MDRFGRLAALCHRVGLGLRKLGRKFEGRRTVRLGTHWPGSLPVKFAHSLRPLFLWGNPLHVARPSGFQ